MIAVPPAPWKTATTGTLVVVVVAAVLLGGAFAWGVWLAFSDANRPMSPQEREAIWRAWENQHKPAKAGP